MLSQRPKHDEHFQMALRCFRLFASGEGLTCATHLSTSFLYVRTRPSLSREMMKASPLKSFAPGAPTMISSKPSPSCQSGDTIVPTSLEYERMTLGEEEERRVATRYGNRPDVPYVRQVGARRSHDDLVQTVTVLSGDIMILSFGGDTVVTQP
jgi:hypothetical protein